MILYQFETLTSSHISLLGSVSCIFTSSYKVEGHQKY